MQNEYLLPRNLKPHEHVMENNLNLLYLWRQCGITKTSVSVYILNPTVIQLNNWRREQEKKESLHMYVYNVWYRTFKGTVQWQVTGVESGINRLIILNCLDGHFPFFNFKGTPSWEEHKTVPSVFTTFESSSTGRVCLLQSSVSPSNCCTVPQFPRTATVRRETLPNIFLCWLAPIDGDDNQCTASVQYMDETVQ